MSRPKIVIRELPPGLYHTPAHPPSLYVNGPKKNKLIKFAMEVKTVEMVPRGIYQQTAIWED